MGKMVGAGAGAAQKSSRSATLHSGTAVQHVFAYSQLPPPQKISSQSSSSKEIFVKLATMAAFP
jgi:hypothetical protein